jgi:hypothetical protein
MIRLLVRPRATSTSQCITKGLLKSALMVLLVWTVASSKPKSQAVSGPNSVTTTKIEDGLLRAGFDMLSSFKSEDPKLWM